MKINEITEYIGDLIGKDDLPRAIQELSILLQSNKRLDELIIQSARYTELTQQIRTGTIDFSQADLRKNQIRFAILDLIREIEHEIEKDKSLESNFHEEEEKIKIIIDKRFISYPLLLEILIENTIDWFLESKEYTLEWANNYISKLRSFETQYGIYLSEEVYAKFYLLKSILIEMRECFEQGKNIEQYKVFNMVKIVMGDDEFTGLATVLKKEIGSFASDIESNSDLMRNQEFEKIRNYYPINATLFHKLAILSNKEENQRAQEIIQCVAFKTIPKEFKNLTHGDIMKNLKNKWRLNNSKGNNKTIPRTKKK